MSEDYISNLLRIFERFDTKSKWNIDPDEAVQILLEGEAERRSFEDAEEFLDNKMFVFEAIVHERGGRFGSDPMPIEEIIEALELSPHKSEKQERNYIDLSDKKEITLSNGKKIPIN